MMKLPLFQGNRIDASNVAVVMAIGIFFMGITTRFSLSNELPAYVVDLLLFLFGCFLYQPLCRIFTGSFRKRYLTHPVQSFAVGSWVAGTSILCIVLYMQFPIFKEVIIVVALLNGILWIFGFFIYFFASNVIK